MPLQILIMLNRKAAPCLTLVEEESLLKKLFGDVSVAMFRVKHSSTLLIGWSNMITKKELLSLNSMLSWAA